MGVNIVQQRGNAVKYTAMTFPSFRKLLDGVGTDHSVIAIGADHLGMPAGLLLCQIVTGPNHKKTAEILSVFVKKNHRRQGYSQAMFNLLEQELMQRKIDAVELKFTTVNKTGNPAVTALDKTSKEASQNVIAPNIMEELLAKLGWPRPTLRMMLFDVPVKKLVTAKWVEEINDQQQVWKIDYWQNVSEIERARLQRADWVPEELAPHKHQQQALDGKPVIPGLCFALRHEDEIVGWHFTHKLDDQTLRFSVSYIRPDLQQDLLLLKLWYHAGIAAEKAGFLKARLGVSIRHKSMMQFCERFLSPLADKVEYSKGAFKLLLAEEEAVWV